jgi:hypothetical protein
MAADDAKAIVERAIEAQGGLAKLSKVKAQSWQAKGKMLAGGEALEYTATYTMMAPDKLYFDSTINVGGMKLTIRAATDGSTAWEASGDQLRDMAKEKQVEFQHNVHLLQVTQLYPILDPAYKLTLLPDLARDGQSLVGVKVTREGQRDVRLYFDKKTNLLARTETQVIDEFLKREVTQESLVSGWHVVDGRQVFDQLTIRRDGKDMIIETHSNQKFLDEGDRTLFAKPKKP